MPRIRLPGAGAGTASPIRQAWRLIRERVVLPAPMLWEVQPVWAILIIGGWAAIWLLLAGVLTTLGPDEPFSAPSAGATRNLARTAAAMWNADDALTAGRLDEARAASRIAIDQAPASPAARALVARVNHAVEIERTSAATQKRVSELVEEGRGAYRSGQYSRAAERFTEALEFDPQSEIASEYLELAQDRTRQTRRRTSPNTPTQPKPLDLQLSPAVVPAASQEPGNARVTLYYNCPINAGSVTIAVDGETVSDIPFDHTKKGFLGLKTEGRGAVKRVLLVPSGKSSLTVTLIDRKRGVIGSRTFSQTLPNDSQWTLRIDQPKSEAEPAFFLVRTSH